MSGSLVTDRSPPEAQERFSSSERMKLLIRQAEGAVDLLRADWLKKVCRNSSMR